MNPALLHQVEQRIREDSVPTGGTHFAGADLIITDDPERSRHDGDVVVTSHFAGEISWVVGRMKEVFADEIDYINKLTFYPEIGRAARAAVESGASRTDILLAIVDAAKDFWSNRPLTEQTEFQKALERLRSTTYFAYGSNLLHEQMKERCPEAVFVGAGSTDGYRFLINNRRDNKRGVATLASDSGSKVFGAIYRLTEANITSLDKCEGVASGDYEKRTIEAIAMENGETFDCLVYIDPCTELGHPRPGYLEKVLRGARDCGLPSTYINFLESFAGPEG